MALDVSYIERSSFRMRNIRQIEQKVGHFISEVDVVYLTVDLDGFAASVAPGVSAPSPFGFDVEVALSIMDQILESNKLVSMDVAELNPKFDVDGHTAKLAAYLIAHVIQNYRS